MQAELVYKNMICTFSPPYSYAETTPPVFIHRPEINKKKVLFIPFLFLINCHGIARRLVHHAEWIGGRKFAPPSGRTTFPLIAVGEEL
ncbi:MAG TPA: hypothetical protein PKW95_08295 [bacterium]|nr:hypothetical protein [bacterium]